MAIETSPQKEIKPNQVITFHLSRPIKWGEIGVYTTAMYGGGAGGAYLVRKYRLGELPAGNHAITWDGRNELGEKVAPGTYVYMLTIEDTEQYSIVMPHAPASGYGCVENLIKQGWDLPQAAKQCDFYEEVPEEIRGSAEMMTCIEEFIRRTPGLPFSKALKGCVIVEQIISTTLPTIPTIPVTPTLEEVEFLKRLKELEEREKEKAKEIMPSWIWIAVAAGALLLFMKR